MQRVSAPKLVEALKTNTKTIRVLGGGVGYLTADKSEVIDSLSQQPDCYVCSVKETTDTVYIGD